MAARAHATMWGQTAWSDAADTPWRYPGQYHDDETGLHYNRFRYYHPDTGRYLTGDPLGLAPAPNPYGYPINPTVNIDPLGLMPYKASDILARNMEEDGLGVRPDGYAAHHIVAHSAAAAAFAREILADYGIDINAAANGVYLPSNAGTPNPTGMAVHSSLHTREYYTQITNALQLATTRVEALQILAELRQQLQNGWAPR